MKITYFLLFAISCFGLHAENAEVQRLEGDLFVGLTEPMGNYHNGDATVGPAFGAELRYNVAGTPWDFGIQLSVATAVRKFNHPYPGYDDEYDQSNRSVNLMAVGDYNLRQGQKINPFAGLGFGVSFNDVVSDKIYNTSGTSAVVMPRIGVEFFKCLRITVAPIINRKGYNTCMFTLGYTFGGR